MKRYAYYEANEGTWVRAEDALALEARVRELEERWTAEVGHANKWCARVRELEHTVGVLTRTNERIRAYCRKRDIVSPAERAVLDASALVPSRRLRQFIALEDSSLTDWAKTELARREAK